MTDATDPDTAHALAADLQRVIRAMLAAVRDDAAATDGPVALVTVHLDRPLDEVCGCTWAATRRRATWRRSSRPPTGSPRRS